MTEQEAFEAWFDKRGVWPRLTYDEIWNAALEWARTQQEPVAFIGGTDGMLWQEQCDDNDIPLYVAPILPAPADRTKIGFSPMCLAPIDGTPVLLHMPTTTDGFAVGQWHGNFWGDDEGSAYVHDPIGWMGLHVLKALAAAPECKGETK